MISLGYYLRVVVVMFMQPAEAGRQGVTGRWMSTLALGVASFGVLLVGVVPWFYDLAVTAVQSFFHYGS